MDEIRLDGRVAIVTGGGRGIGRAHAQLLAARGCQVVVNDPGVAWDGQQTEAEPAEEAVAVIAAEGGIAIADTHSVVDESAEIVETALDAYGRLDIVVNNAGITTIGAFPEVAKADFDLVMATHLGGTVEVVRASWPHLVASGSGRIVNVASDALYGSPLNTAYAAAKGAILGFTRTLALDAEADGIRVNAILPIGYSRLHAVNANERSRQLFAEKFPPEMVASFVVWLSHPSMLANGEAFSVGGGRVARVVMAETPGVVLDDSTPEAWAAHMQKVLDVEPAELFVIKTSNEKRLWLLGPILGLMDEEELTAGDQQSVTFATPAGELTDPLSGT